MKKQIQNYAVPGLRRFTRPLLGDRAHPGSATKRPGPAKSEIRITKSETDSRQMKVPSCSPPSLQVEGSSMPIGRGPGVAAALRRRRTPPRSLPFKSQIANLKSQIPSAFTLIELLVVIAIIAVLASMIFPVTRAVNRTKTLTRARGELAEIETAIASYKAKTGVYPPDDTKPATTLSGRALAHATNPLYYELVGTTVISPSGAKPVYQTLDGSTQISAANAAAAFGVSGFVNSDRGGGGDEGQQAQNFFPNLAQQNIGEFRMPSGATVRVLVSSVPWPTSGTGAYSPLMIPGAQNLNPWRYNSSNPTNNPASYDLWVDVIINGQTNRISNWSSQPIIVGQPY
jgi:prepilin-type N-terminal cleavage/methylation domain-containing protein